MKKIDFGYLFLAELIIVDFLYKYLNDYLNVFNVIVSVLCIGSIIYLKIKLRQKKLLSLFVVSIAFYIGINFVLYMGSFIGVIFAVVLCITMLLLKCLFIKKDRLVRLNSAFAISVSLVVQIIWVFSKIHDMSLIIILFGSLLSILIYEYSVY